MRWYLGGANADGHASTGLAESTSFHLDKADEPSATASHVGAGEAASARSTVHSSDEAKTDEDGGQPFASGGGSEAAAGSGQQAAVPQNPPPSAEPSAQAAAPGKSQLRGVTVRVYLTDSGKVEKVPIETYVMGVLAGEMPIDFELEALKAQAIAARTYIVRRLASGDNEMAGRGADVSDTVQHQAYVSKKELDRRWEGEAEAGNLAKLAQAVRETEGLVVTYGGEPIEAAFFSTSNGFTENSEEYWTMALPYLRSVDSHWDKSISPRYEQEETFELSRFYKLLGLAGKRAKGKPSIKLIGKTEGNRIKSLSVNGTVFTGREARERLGLASSQFGWKIGKEDITFTTYGFGHGVGMSQWGANGMAQEGRSAADILLHYYSGTKVEQASKLPRS